MTATRVSHLSDARQTVAGINKALRKTDAIDLSADQATVTIDRDVDVDGVLKIEGVQVVGAQGAAVADATDAATAITQLNALLARMRAHGLIDT
jgi:hypothetical protein